MRQVTGARHIPARIVQVEAGDRTNWESRHIGPDFSNLKPIDLNSGNCLAAHASYSMRYFTLCIVPICSTSAMVHDLLLLLLLYGTAIIVQDSKLH